MQEGGRESLQAGCVEWSRSRFRLRGSAGTAHRGSVSAGASRGRAVALAVLCQQGKSARQAAHHSGVSEPPRSWAEKPGCVSEVLEAQLIVS